MKHESRDLLVSQILNSTGLGELRKLCWTTVRKVFEKSHGEINDKTFAVELAELIGRCREILRSHGIDSPCLDLSDERFYQEVILLTVQRMLISAKL